ncbi:Capsule polysaccharide export protein [Roseibacterium elongatum DSM 19469]|uniref:Capsule polysaccharide export protein n=1 Tax=Roseicyclus elongatus DSM 19469 TaxID=1294273 RepID=W8RQY8_9RHOB|nr:polysaccharide biosynthesis/export family protein [Roseibacterium elongatum]AHM03584.1 Capsule polysaccharide export protein [Roseibacterium elongatum DSM 19469]
MRAISILKGIAAMAMVASLVACSGLPGGAPVQREIVEASGDEAAADFAVYTVNRAFLPILSDWPDTGERHLGWISTSGGARTQVLAPGDRLRVTVWDSIDDSLITNGEPSAVLESIVVAPDGTIFVPYLGNTRVSGMTLQLAREHLQDEMSLIVPQAQVQLTVESGRGNSIDLVGGVANPGRFPMPDRNYTILNLLADGGGVENGLSNAQVRLMRNGAIYGVSVDRLFAEPGLDTLLHAGDRVIVEEDRRYFLSLGAAGEQSQHTFPRDTVSALDAMSIIGGVQSSRGDPGGILVLREYPASAVRPDAAGPDQQRVVFTLDLTNADGLFSARNFHLNSGDLVLVTESPVTRTQTIFALIGSAFGLVGQGSRLGVN